MRKILAFLLCLTVVNAFGQFTRNATNLPVANHVKTNHYLLVDRGGGLPPASVRFDNLFSASNQVVTVGDYFTFSTGIGDPAQIIMVKNHGTGHGYVALGGLAGDVVISPTLSSGVFQMGATGNAGSYQYLQYATDADATYPIGFSHPLEFRANSTNSATGGGDSLKLPGIVGYAYSANASSPGELRFYGKTPHWNNGNKDPENPNIAGVEVFRANTNALTLVSGARFIGDGSGLTNISAGGTGLTTEVILPGDVVAQYTSGSLSAITAIDSTAAAYFARAGVTNNIEKAAINRVIRRMKASATSFNWTNYDCAYFFPKSTNFGFNAVSSSFDVTWSGGVVQASTGGIALDGVNDWGDTGFNPLTASSPHFKTNAHSMIVYSATTNPTDTRVLIAVQNGNLAALLRNGSFARYWADAGSSWAQVNTAGDMSGLWIGVRENVSSKTLYMPSNSNNDTTTMGTFPSSTFYIGARNNGGADKFFDGTIRYILIGGALDAPGVAEAKAILADFKTDMQALGAW